jgi:hypothetical protein
MPIHPPGTIENGLDPEAYKGMVDPLTLPQVASSANKEEKGEKKIDISEIIGIPDFDVSSRPPRLLAYRQSTALREPDLACEGVESRAGCTGWNAGLRDRASKIWRVKTNGRKRLDVF